MIEKVIIKDNTNTPLHYLSDLPNFVNGKTYEFKAGVNIIVGENGCGKTTLLNLIRSYLLVDDTRCAIGSYNNNILKLFPNLLDLSKFHDGVDVYADYKRNTFRFCHFGERSMSDPQDKEDFADLADMIEQKCASTGEGVTMALQSLFAYMFGRGAELTFDYKQPNIRRFRKYIDYVESHKIVGDEWTILMDEPDRNLDISRIDEILGILSFHKENVQIIATIHNPLLIYALSNKDVNIIEMTDGYVKKVREKVNHLVNGGTKKMKKT